METQLKGTFPLCRFLHSQLHHSESAEGNVFRGAGVSICIIISFSLGGNVGWNEAFFLKINQDPNSERLEFEFYFYFLIDV